MTVTITENRVALTASENAVTVAPVTQTTSISVASGLSQTAGDALYARLAAENTFTAGALGVGAEANPHMYPDPAFGEVFDYIQVYDDVTTFPDNTAFDLGQVVGVRSYLSIEATSTPNSLDSVNAGFFKVDITDENAIDLYNIVGIQGQAVQNSAHTIAILDGMNFSAFQYGSGTIAAMHGAYLEATNYSAGAGTVTEAAVLYIERDFADGTITTKYGLFIGNQENAGHVTTAWSIWTNGGGHHFGGFVDMPEISAPAAPTTNNARLFVRDNGAGKSQLCVRFPTGAIQVIAQEP